LVRWGYSSRNSVYLASCGAAFVPHPVHYLRRTEFRVATTPTHSLLILPSFSCHYVLRKGVGLPDAGTRRRIHIPSGNRALPTPPLAGLPASAHGLPHHPEERRQAGAACIQSVAMFRSELRLKGDHVPGTMGRAEDLQRLVNQEARATTGCFRPTYLRCALEQVWPAGSNSAVREQAATIRATPAQPTAGRADTGGGGRSVSDRPPVQEFYCVCRTNGERSAQGEPETLDSVLVQREEVEAKMEAEKMRPGLTMFTEGSLTEDGAAGYEVAWRKDKSWAGIKNPMGYNQGSYDAECAARARALESASRGRTVPQRVKIFTDVQAAIRQMASDEPGPRQQYAPQARKHTAALCSARLGIIIGAQHTRVSPAMRRPRSGRRLLRRSQIPMGIVRCMGRGPA